MLQLLLTLALNVWTRSPTMSCSITWEDKTQRLPLLAIRLLKTSKRNKLSKLRFLAKAGTILLVVLHLMMFLSKCFLSDSMLWKKDKAKMMSETTLELSNACIRKPPRSRRSFLLIKSCKSRSQSFLITLLLTRCFTELNLKNAVSILFLALLTPFNKPLINQASRMKTSIILKFLVVESESLE